MMTPRRGFSVRAILPDRVQVLHKPGAPARVEGLARTAERNFCLSAFSMHRYHDLPLVPLLMLTVIDAASLLHEPFSECGAFHCSAPVGYRI
jgi:hypothetical protein